MKSFLFSPKFVKKLRKIAQTDRKLNQLIKKQLGLFKNSSKHHSLRLHKLRGNLNNTWSISINKSFRVIYTEETESYYFIDLGTHDEIYEK